MPTSPRPREPSIAIPRAAEDEEDHAGHDSGAAGQR